MSTSLSARWGHPINGREAKTVLEAARQECGLSVEELWFRYVELGGTSSIATLDAYLEGILGPERRDQEILAQALNERLWELDLNPTVVYAWDDIDVPGAWGENAAVVQSPTVSVVIPTLNEAKNLPEVLAAIPDRVGEVIIVDGHSTDETVAVARTCRPDVKIVLQDGRGKGNAVACGLKAVTGDITVLLDADGSTDPAEIPRFVGVLVDGCDVAKGSRFKPGGGSSDMTFLRRVGNRALTWLVNLIWGVRYTDLCYGYNAFWTRCASTLRPDCNGFEIETLMNIRMAVSGLRVTEVPSFETERRYGSSNLSVVRDGLRVLRTIFAEFIRPN